MGCFAHLKKSEVTYIYITQHSHAYTKFPIPAVKFSHCGNSLYFKKSKQGRTVYSTVNFSQTKYNIVELLNITNRHVLLESRPNVATLIRIILIRYLYSITTKLLQGLLICSLKNTVCYAEIWRKAIYSIKTNCLKSSTFVWALP